MTAGISMPPAAVTVVQTPDEARSCDGGGLEIGVLMKYAVVIEKAESNYSAYVPDLPGCVATGSTIEEAESQIREAIEFHLEGMRTDGESIPEPSSTVEYVEVTA